MASQPSHSPHERKKVHWGYMGIMEKKMESTGVLGVTWGFVGSIWLYRDNAKGNGNYYLGFGVSCLGFRCWLVWPETCQYSPSPSKWTLHVMDPLRVDSSVQAFRAPCFMSARGGTINPKVTSLAPGTILSRNIPPTLPGGWLGLLPQAWHNRHPAAHRSQQDGSC